MIAMYPPPQVSYLQSPLPANALRNDRSVHPTIFLSSMSRIVCSSTLHVSTAPLHVPIESALMNDQVMSRLPLQRIPPLFFCTTSALVYLISTSFCLPTTFLSLSSLLVYRLNCNSPMYVQVSVRLQGRDVERTLVLTCAERARCLHVNPEHGAYPVRSRRVIFVPSNLRALATFHRCQYHFPPRFPQPSTIHRLVLSVIALSSYLSSVVSLYLSISLILSVNISHPVPATSPLSISYLQLVSLIF
jgi:hypothetical protein